MKFAEFYVGQTIGRAVHRRCEAEILAFAGTPTIRNGFTPIRRPLPRAFWRVDRQRLAHLWRRHAPAVADAALKAFGVVRVSRSRLRQMAASRATRRCTERTRHGDRVPPVREAPRTGRLRWRWQLFNASSTEVLDLEATSLFDPLPADHLLAPFRHRLVGFAPMCAWLAQWSNNAD